MNKCPVIEKYGEEKKKQWDIALTNYRNKSDKLLEQCAAILSQTTKDLDQKMYYSKIATQSKY